jgi:RecB family endonuclease NucS
MLGKHQLPSIVQDQGKEALNTFKSDYVFEFLRLPDQHNESDLQKALVAQMKRFILELGRDFIFMGEEYGLQVGNSDFKIDLLFFHRGLQCLVVVELKAEKFKPEHLGQLNFYLEALDRDVKKENENPSIGILLCRDQDTEVVKYAMNRTLSPTLVASYQTQLPDKSILQQKWKQIMEETIK